MRGFLILDKPAGVTSARILAPLRRSLGHAIKVGHAGTLDPFATGAILALLGDATRLSHLAMGLAKTYDTTIRFGEETDTLDPEGEVVRRSDPGPGAPAELEAALARFVGDVEQEPPVYSAVKVQGTPAYRLARQGRAPELRARTVRIHSIDLLAVDWPEVRIRVHCGAGTYVRSLARDIGARLGHPASLVRLCRTQVGPFGCGEALRFPADASLEKDSLRAALRDPLELVTAAGVPTVVLSAAEALRLARGNPVPAAGRGGAGVVGVVVEGDGPVPSLVGLARSDPPGILRPATIFASERSRLEARGMAPRGGRG